MADSDPLDTPNCPADLTPMEVGGTDERPFWVCPTCGAVALTA